MVKGVLVIGVMMSGAMVSCALVSGALNRWAESVAGNEDLGVGNGEVRLVVKLRCYRIGQW